MNPAAEEGAQGTGARSRSERRARLDAAILDALRVHEGEYLSLRELVTLVAPNVSPTPRESAVSTAARGLAHDTDHAVFRAPGVRYSWSSTGVRPAIPVPERAAAMIARRHEGASLEQIGTEFSVTRERVRQIVSKYGGPAGADLRAQRAKLKQERANATRQATADAIRAAVLEAGPMTVAAAAARIGAAVETVNRNWPSDILQLRLYETTRVEQWSDEQILQGIRDAAVYEFPLTTKAYGQLLRVGQIVGVSIPRIGQRFGTWSAACDAAGVEHGQAVRTYQSRWTDEDLLEYSRQFFRHPDFRGAAHRFDEWKRLHAPDGPSMQTLRNRFGTWNEIKQRAIQ